ncbi:hypothetical protein M0805_002598 [Coniferiporia weirii]|nr:hypothetical protein M0805_002598 [Coniferiporia weirii]
MEGSFGIVTQNLLSLGSFPIENLANSPKADLEGFDLPYVSSDPDLTPGSSQPPPEAGQVFSDEKEKTSDSMQFVAQLHQTCKQTFGNSEALVFEFIDEGGPDRKQCILTITRPNGMSRSYTTEPEFSRKSDAKARAAAIAVEMNAVDFILHGNKDASKSRSTLVLAPLDSTSVKQESKIKEEGFVNASEDDEISKQILECCIEWRANQVQPRWIFFSEHKGSPTIGCALLVELSLHSQRAYSVSAVYDSKPSAKKGCSEAAIRQGVIDFIKFGNGQTAPTVAPVELLEDVNVKREPEFERGRPAATTLQTFFDALPKPFPESIGDKTAASVNASGMLNTTLQLAKGARLSLQFYFINNNGLHGCIIRLDRPEETRTYIVNPRFAKRADAKAAVCLLAMSQGISQYIRSVAASVENRITPEMRKKANEQILPILGSEYAKLRHGMHPTYEFDHDQGAFGCTMFLSLSADPKPEETRKWIVKPEYRTKTDAKIAVVYLAGQEAIEFVRFRGEPVPPDHDPFKPYKRAKEHSQNPERSKKEDTSTMPSSRGATEQRLGSIPKRPVAASGMVRLGPPAIPLLETKEEAMARQRAEQKRRQTERFQPSRPPVRQAPASRPPPPPFTSGSSQRPPPSRDGISSYSRSPYDVGAAATAIIDRLTSPSSAGPSLPSQYPSPPLSYPPKHTPPRSQRASSHSPPQPSSQVHPSYATSKPPHLQCPSKPSPPPQRASYAVTQAPQPLQQPLSHPPQQHSPFHFPPYGVPPQSSHQHFQYSASPYTTAYAQAAYPYPIQSGAPFPSPSSAYPVPPTTMTSPTSAYGVTAYPYAYYVDPRYAPYPIPGMPVPYAVPVPAQTPGFPYPPPPPEQSSTSPTQWVAPVATSAASSTPKLDQQMSVSESSAESTANAGVATPVRTASLSASSDRQKRPRSREGSPEDAQKHKKQRSESALPQPTSVKRESTSVSPAPLTPVSSSAGPSSVEQLLQYCGSEGIAWPEFGSMQMKNEHGEDVFKVWIIMGKERLELPGAFLTENEGRQRVAKQVLQRLRSQADGK